MLQPFWTCSSRPPLCHFIILQLPLLGRIEEQEPMDSLMRKDLGKIEMSNEGHTKEGGESLCWDFGEVDELWGHEDECGWTKVHKVESRGNTVFWPNAGAPKEQLQLRDFRMTWDFLRMMQQSETLPTQASFPLSSHRGQTCITIQRLSLITLAPVPFIITVTPSMNLLYLSLHLGVGLLKYLNWYTTP